MSSQEVAMVSVAALVIGVLVAGTLRQLAGWLVQTAGRLLLVAAILAVLWLVMKPGASPHPANPPATAWWE